MILGKCMSRFTWEGKPRASGDDPLNMEEAMSVLM